MPDTTMPNSSSDAASSAVDNHHLAPDPTILPGAEKSLGVAVGFLKHAVRGAHAGIDHLADGAEPVLQGLEEGFTASREALHAKADQWRDRRGAWTEGVRDTIRSNPLTSIAAALALGLVIARLSRPGITR